MPALTALNERLRDDYIEEIADGVSRWQRVIDNAGVNFKFKLPHKGFHREIGNFAGHFISPEGEVLSEEAWKNHASEWLPSAEDYKFVQSLMTGRVVEPINGRVTGRQRRLKERALARGGILEESIAVRHVDLPCERVDRRRAARPGHELLPPMRPKSGARFMVMSTKPPQV